MFFKRFFNFEWYIGVLGFWGFGDVCAMISCSLGIMSVNTSFLAVSSSESAPGQQNFKLVWPSWETCYGERDPSPHPRPFRQNLLQLHTVAVYSQYRDVKGLRKPATNTVFYAPQVFLLRSLQSRRAVLSQLARLSGWGWIGWMLGNLAVDNQKQLINVDKKRVGDLRERWFSFGKMHDI